MKKLLAVVLILALLLPVAAFADDSDVVGCWAHYELLTTGCPNMEMIYLAPDHTCYFLIQSFKSDDAGLGRTFVGTWEMQSDGTVLAKTGNNTSTVLSFSPNYQAAVNTITLGVYINLSVFDSKIY